MGAIHIVESNTNTPMWSYQPGPAHMLPGGGQS